MMQHTHKFLASLLMAGFALTAACQDEATTMIASEATPASSKAEPGDMAQTSPGKPSAPISMRYEVLGSPVVGAPVAINVEVNATGDHGPIRVRYSIADSSALVFQQGQVVDLELDERKRDRGQQLAVIPQREGRMYVNVSAEVQTAGGSMIKSMAIPVQVGSAPERPTGNGELKQGPEGETVISLPATETN